MGDVWFGYVDGQNLIISELQANTNKNDYPLNSCRTNQWIVMKFNTSNDKQYHALNCSSAFLYTCSKNSHIMVCPSVMSIRPSIRKTFLFWDKSSYFVIVSLGCGNTK